MFTFFSSRSATYIIVHRKKSKQIGHYILHTLSLESGERLPVLRDASSGEPLYDPLMFCLTELRGTGLATNTMLQALRSVMLLLLVLDELKVDIKARLKNGLLLDHHELEGVARACSLELQELRREPSAPSSRTKVGRQREAVRMPAGLQPLKEVLSSTMAIRIHYVRKYLTWLANSQLLRLRLGSVEYKHLLMARDVAADLLNEKIPSRGSRNTAGQREGLAPAAVARLLEVIQIDHPDNPWRHATRVRNNLMVRWYFHLGLRRAELLCVKVIDISFQSSEVLIARRPNDPEDMRQLKPDGKTADRVLPIDRTLAKDTHEYVTKMRRCTGQARNHPFLFVAIPSGAPLSMSAVNLMFSQLRSKVPEMPEDFSPHVLRHTWNDRFSELADKEGFEPAEEKKIRSRLMGWSESSNTAATYTRRHIKKKARAASLALQEAAMPQEKKR